MEGHNCYSKNPLPVNLSQFHISEEFGFILPNPLTDLPSYYRPWMEIATNLVPLIEKHELRSEIDKMPLLTVHNLNGHRQLRLAHLVLSSMTMGYVWQEGEQQTIKVLPKNLAVPFWEVSQLLGLPPVLVHANFLLANWRKRDLQSTMDIEDMELIISLPGGESMRGFVLVTLLVEKAAAPAAKAVVQAINAILEHDDESLINALQQLTKSIAKMKEALKKMHDYTDPEIFYSVIRIFFSGWKDNSAMPDGLLYEGVSDEPMFYAGGNAAQSTIFSAMDELLGVQHKEESAAFLQRMRDYMLPSQRAFLKQIQETPSLHDHVTSSENIKLREAYNSCVNALVEFRNYHITVVSKYVSAAGAIARAKARANRNKDASIGWHLPTPPSSLVETGTGGTTVVSFLKSVRDSTKNVALGD